MSAREHAVVGVVMGSRSDLETMEHATKRLEELGIPHEVLIVSAHRTPDWMAEYARTAESRGLRILIAGAGGAAHLPGMLAAHTLLPVLGVPVVATAVGSLPEVLGDAARLVPDDDAAALADALDALLTDDAARAALVAAGRARAARYSWTATADALAALYRDLAA